MIIKLEVIIDTGGEEVDAEDIALAVRDGIDVLDMPNGDTVFLNAVRVYVQSAERNSDG